MHPHQPPRRVLQDLPAPDPPRRRHAPRPAAAALGACVLVVAGLGRYTYLRRTTPLDLAVDRHLQPLADRAGPLADLLVRAASPRPVLALCLTVAVLLLVTGKTRPGAVCVLAPTSALVTSALLQDLLRRPSATITHGADAYPSGHMTAAVALAAVCWVVAGSLSGQHRTSARWLRTSSSLYALAVGLALTGLRHHYVTDNLGGAAVALAGLALAWWLIHPFDRVSRPGPAHS